MKKVVDTKSGNPYHSEETGQFTSPDDGATKNLPAWLNKRDENGERVLPPWLKKKSEVDSEQSETKKEEVREKVVFEKFNLNGIDSDYAEEMRVVFDSLMDEYPINHLVVETCTAQYKLGYFMYGLKGKRNSSGTITYIEVRPVRIRINKISNATKNRSFYEHRENYMIRGSKLQNLSNCGLATCYHEYAHAITWDLARTIKQNDADAIAYNNAIGKGEIYSIEKVLMISQGSRAIDEERKSIESRIYSRLRNEYNLTGYEMKKRVLSEFGSYAAKSHGEFIAEAFANMKMLKDEDKTDFLRSFERIFVEEYKKIKEKR